MTDLLNNQRIFKQVQKETLHYLNKKYIISLFSEFEKAIVRSMRRLKSEGVKYETDDEVSSFCLAVYEELKSNGGLEYEHN